MAFVVSQKVRHNCREEIAADIVETDMYAGSVVECSCGKQFEKRYEQRDGAYWAELPRES